MLSFILLMIFLDWANRTVVDYRIETYTPNEIERWCIERGLDWYDPANVTEYYEWKRSIDE